MRVVDYSSLFYGKEIKISEQIFLQRLWQYLDVAREKRVVILKEFTVSSKPNLYKIWKRKRYLLIARWIRRSNQKDRKRKGYERLRKRIEREYVKIYQFTDFQIDLLEEQVAYFNKLGKKLLHKANPLIIHEQHHWIPLEKYRGKFVPIIPDGVDFHAQVLKHFNG